MLNSFQHLMLPFPYFSVMLNTFQHLVTYHLLFVTVFGCPVFVSRYHAWAFVYKPDRFQKPVRFLAVTTRKDSRGSSGWLYFSIPINSSNKSYLSSLTFPFNFFRISSCSETFGKGNLIEVISLFNSFPPFGLLFK